MDRHGTVAIPPTSGARSRQAAEQTARVVGVDGSTPSQRVAPDVPAV
jgi:hypothetical protein